MSKLLLIFLLFLHPCSAFSDENYDVTISADIPSRVNGESFDADVMVVFNNIDLYNDSIKLSYHIYDTQGRQIRYENQRVPVILHEDKAVIPMKINLSGLGIKAGTDLDVRFDLIDDKNLFWFADQEHVKKSFLQFQYTSQAPMNPKELLRATAQPGESQSKNIVKNLKDSTKYILNNQKKALTLNTVFIFSLVVLIIWRKQSRKSLLPSLTSYYDKRDVSVNEVEREGVKLEPRMNTLVEWGTNKLFARLYSRLDAIEKFLKKHENDSCIIKEIRTMQCDNFEHLKYHQSHIENFVTTNFEQIKAHQAQSAQQGNQLIIDIQTNFSRIHKSQYESYSENKNLLYELFCSLLSIQGIRAQEIYENFVHSLDVTKEFAFYDTLPINNIKKYIDEYKDAVVVGALPGLLTKFIGKGVAVKLIAYGNVQEINKGELLCPIFLIPEVMPKAEVFVSTNPYFSRTLIYSENILEELVLRTSECVILPIQIDILGIQINWHSFSIVERDAVQETFWRWAVGFDVSSFINVQNNTVDNVYCTISFTVAFARENATIDIECGSLKCHKESLGRDIIFSITGEVMPGDNNLVFVYSGANEKVGSDPRELKFLIRNFTVKSIGVPNQSIESNYKHRNIENIDYEIRQRLHNAGLFTIKPILVVNKGFYEEDLPVSTFSIFGDVNIEKDTHEQFLKYATSSGSSSVCIVYKGFRKGHL